LKEGDDEEKTQTLLDLGNSRVKNLCPLHILLLLFDAKEDLILSKIIV
jgi:hypothetical protein